MSLVKVPCPDIPGQEKIKKAMALVAGSYGITISFVEKTKDIRMEKLLMLKIGLVSF